MRSGRTCPWPRSTAPSHSELPGLRLTCRQAQRLWNLDQIVCEALLAALVDVRFLVESDGVYLQRGDVR